MQCFCKEEKKQGYQKSQEYLYTDKEGIDHQIPICRDFFNDLLISKVLGQSIVLNVVIINILLKYSIIYMVK